MSDRTTKILLVAIALGLWANFLAGFIHPHAVAAQDMSTIDSRLSNMESDIHKIARGTCVNSKICD